MSCEVEQIADCGDTSNLGRALFITEREDKKWLTQCSLSLSSCGNLLAVGHKTRLCLLTSQWISSTDSNTYLVTWSGTLPSDITTLLALPICPSQQSSQNGPDWFCIIVGFKTGSVGFYTNTGHLLLMEKLDEKPVMKISCHTGTYGTLPEDIHILFQTCECVVSGPSLFQTLRNAKTQLAKVQAGFPGDYAVDSRNINIRKWTFTDHEAINDAEVVGLELKNAYDHLLAASTYGGYDTWYRSVPPVNSLILGAGGKPYVGFHYALEGGTTPPLQDVARAVANKIKSALPGWLGGNSSENTPQSSDPVVRSETLTLRSGLYDAQRQGSSVVISPDRRLAAIADNFGRVAVLDVKRGHLIRLFKGYREAQCAFVQIFDVDHKKPQMSTVKEIKRAMFLIIYNPKKGLIDIRLMQRGNRVAVFTATKNGQLIYNTCGLVGAEKNYNHKKLNFPEFQCVLLDPDGKFKRFTIPFFYALDGEHSERSKDLHTLRELRDSIKKASTMTEDLGEEIINRAADLKTLQLKKHCLEILIRSSEIPLKIVMSCLKLFWNSMQHDNLNSQEEEIKRFYINLGLLTLFYRNINSDNTDDMKEWLAIICNNDSLPIEEQENVHVNYPDKSEDDTSGFHLLEDDNCILERLLNLAQENDYKEHQHARVKFADSKTNNFKEFISSFTLDQNGSRIVLKSDVPIDKLNRLASETFKSIFQMKKLQMLTLYVKKSNIDPKCIVQILIMHVMNMPLEEITIELIEKLIETLFNLCCATEEATHITYNEVSLWWQSIRDILVEMSCPLRSMIVAMACKAVGKIFESQEEAWESVTTENAKWGILIGKLEDISILSIILMFKDEFRGKQSPMLQFDDFNINLKFIYTRGKGSITELIAKWLCSMGVPPEAVVANELIEMETASNFDKPNNTDPESNIDPDSFEKLFLENHRKLVDDNPKIFKWLSLLRRQFPLSTIANYIVANMCWENAIAWQKNTLNTKELQAVVSSLTNITDLHLRLGLFSIIWSTYIKHAFEVICRLVNKVGRLPKDPLCLQDVGLSNTNMVKFLEIVTDYLNIFSVCTATSINQEKNTIRYEKIWDESTPSLVEVAQDAKTVNSDILNLNYQIACTVYYQCHFNLKFSKPLDTLYDIDYQYIIEALAGNIVHREISLKASEKIRNPRMKFITKLIRAAIETITLIENEEPQLEYNNQECTIWIEKILVLAELWNIENDFINRQQMTATYITELKKDPEKLKTNNFNQARDLTAEICGVGLKTVGNIIKVIGLYHLGYDMLAENILTYVKDPELLMPPLLAISIQRLKRSLEHSINQPEWIVSISPNLYKRLQTTVLDTTVPAHPSLTTTVIVLQKLLFQIHRRASDSPSNLQNVKLTELIIENCEVLTKRKL